MGEEIVPLEITMGADGKFQNLFNYGNFKATDLAHVSNATIKSNGADLGNDRIARKIAAATDENGNISTANLGRRSMRRLQKRMNLWNGSNPVNKPAVDEWEGIEEVPIDGTPVDDSEPVTPVYDTNPIEPTKPVIDRNAIRQAKYDKVNQSLGITGDQAKYLQKIAGFTGNDVDGFLGNNSMTRLMNMGLITQGQDGNYSLNGSFNSLGGFQGKDGYNYYDNGRVGGIDGSGNYNMGSISYNWNDDDSADNYGVSFNWDELPLYLLLTYNERFKQNGVFFQKQGGKMTNKYQQGGSVDEQLVALVKAALQGDLKANQLIQQIQNAAKQGDQKATMLMQKIQQVAQLLLQAPAAKKGTKLEYISRLRGKCPEGYEMSYYKSGGVVCSKCMKKAEGGKTETEEPFYISKFKSTRKEKCGGKVKKAGEGEEIKKESNEPSIKRETKNGVTKTTTTGMDDYDGKSKGITYSSKDSSASAYISDRFKAKLDTVWHEGPMSTNKDAAKNRENFYRLKKLHEKKNK